MEYHSALKMKGILTRTTTWIKLEDVTCEVSQSHTHKITIWFPVYEVLRIVKTIETKSRIMVTTVKRKFPFK